MDKRRQDYTCVGTNDLDRAVNFYGELLGLLGLLGAQPFFKVGNGSIIALAASSPEQVQALQAKALALGGTDEGAPGPRGDGFYGTYFRDLDGNKLAAFCMVG